MEFSVVGKGRQYYIKWAWRFDTAKSLDSVLDCQSRQLHAAMSA